MINGRQLARNLGIEIQGTPPRRLSERGDAAFERSRSEALFALHKFEIELKSRRSAEELIQTIHEIRTGERIGEIPLDDCAGKWAELPRRQPLAERYLSWAQKTIARFFAYVRASHHGIRQMSQVQVRMARAFMRDEEKRGVAAATYNKNLILLRSVFEALRREAGMAENPFAGIPTRDGESIFRKPFSVEELGLIVKAGETDSFIQPLIITGMCTAMRKGDCCTLLRSDVDFAGGFVSVKTSKKRPSPSPPPGRPSTCFRIWKRITKSIPITSRIASSGSFGRPDSLTRATRKTRTRRHCAVARSVRIVNMDCAARHCGIFTHSASPG
jgi:integrase